MTVVVAEDRSMCVQPNQVVRTAWVDTDLCRSASSEKAGRNLYGAFIEQNVNASRILIVERASDRRKPDPGLENGRTRAGTARFNCIKAARLGVHSKARNENFQVLQDTC